MIEKDLERQSAAEVGTRPGVVHLISVVEPFEEVGNPTNATLGERHL